MKTKVAINYKKNKTKTKAEYSLRSTLSSKRKFYNVNDA